MNKQTCWGGNIYMRYSRMQNQVKNSGKSEGKSGIFFFLAVLAIAAVIYFVGAAKVGKFLTDKVFAPVFSFFSGEEKEEEQNSEISSTVQSVLVQGETFNLNLQAMNIYALQAGAYSDENNATVYADSLKAKGGAGYIYFDGEIYRVFIAAYATKEDAENVMQRLESEQGIQTKLYEMTYNEKNVSVTADEQTKQELEEIMEDVVGYTEQLINLALEYDKGNIDVTVASEQLQNLMKQADEKETKITELQQAGITNGYITALQVYFQQVEQTLQNMKDAPSQTEMSAFIKYAYMSCAFAQNELVGAFDM